MFACRVRFVEEMEEQYDLIVSNPPFYSEAVSSGDISRDKARQNNSLPFDELLEGVSKLLATDGLFSVILPFKEEEKFQSIASAYHLYPKRATRVKGNPKSEIKRSLMEFSFEKATVVEDELIIEMERHQYTSDYISLTQDFYLKM